MVKIKALGLLLALSSTSWAACPCGYALLPTAEVDDGYTVTVDKPPTAPLGRSVAVPVGTTITVESANRKPFAVVLIGPAGIMDTSQTGKWSGRIVQGGGYRLQFGPEGSDLLAMQSVLDFVAVDDPAQAPSAGDQVSEGLYRQP